MPQTLQTRDIDLDQLQEDFWVVTIEAIGRGDDLYRVAQILKYLRGQVV